MRVTYHSWLRAKVDTETDVIAEDETPGTIGDLSGMLAKRHGNVSELFVTEGALRYVVDRRYVDSSFPLKGVDEIGIYPPVTGG